MPLSYRMLYNRLRKEKRSLGEVCRAAGLCPEAEDLIAHGDPLPPFELSRLCVFLGCDIPAVVTYYEEGEKSDRI